MSNGMAKGYINKPKGLGTDNMTCCIVKFKPEIAENAVQNPEGVDQPLPEGEDWENIYEKENWPPLPEPEGTEEERKAELDKKQGNAIENALLSMTGQGGGTKSGVFGHIKRTPEQEEKFKSKKE